MCEGQRMELTQLFHKYTGFWSEWLYKIMQL